MKDRAMGLLTTAAILALPGLILAAERWNWAAGQMLEHPGWTWVLAMVFVAIAGVLLGIEKRGYWDGLLIDHTNRKSLSRLQALVWGTLIISGIATGMAINIARGCEVPPAGVEAPEGSCTSSAWDLHYPEQFLVLAAISAAVLVLATVANSANQQRGLNNRANLSAQSAGLLLAPGGDAPAHPLTDVVPPNWFFGVVVGKDDVSRSSWSDIAKGDVGSHASYLDLSRVQFLIVSMLVAGAYAVFFLRELTSHGAVTFPDFDAGLNTLLGISAATYLGVKTINGVAAGE